MYLGRNYLEDARKYEEVFRNILRSFSEESRKEKALNPESSLEEIFQKYSSGMRLGKWTILDFKMGPSDDKFIRLSADEALFASQNIATLSGGGSITKYKVGKDNSVKFDSNISSWLS